MKTWRIFAGLLLAVLGMTSLSTAQADDTVYYTQQNLWLFKQETSSINYAVETLVPVNSKVKVVKEKGARLELELVDSGTKFAFEIVKKYTQKPITEFRARLLGTAPVALAKFSKTAQDAIKFGEVRPGMTKAEVLVARGYPPEHATLSTDSDQWKYWQSKWNTIIVQFNNNKVESVKN